MYVDAVCVKLYDVISQKIADWFMSRAYSLHQVR